MAPMTTIIGSGQLYGYRVSGPFDPLRGLRFDADKLLIDPYRHQRSGCGISYS
jgi:isoamylase